ncbi:broad-complex core protein isoforms 1/2/3/4/5 isoform X1 [Vespula pensylvanica]|uniref:broad-complex core protein isoforms 1/2/3/4/5 isoform X1 n=1 Tax=Vespula pensylvanica TaxID=30213 RepID=UPI001CBA4421|nr:broad-complex core protein isoforms 1/2/3/4/5 isoform X1 [Vespula pensylvanica]XP_043670656.1 broad-complex core protein isoforms 1/2/3/4/5 isoform X1 [Vespula pensylvanica]XP_043670657.1 broad-complex core protein isoforms 1/2/3/4/5 isoform X1 [Vespula pensylvanica]XP_043670658.1 broad-complex core protein isoforms 1/2/3/4/5 isoform X1 [Vespula pensylvanica]
MVDTQHFCLRWNNYQSSITSAFENLRDDEDFVDVTLACDGKSLKAHRVVLSACSPYFRELLKSTPCKHPVIVLQDVAFSDLHALVEFIYHGEVNVHQRSLSSFLKTAEVLRVSGLTQQADQTDRDELSHVRALAAGVNHLPFHEKSEESFPRSGSPPAPTTPTPTTVQQLLRRAQIRRNERRTPDLHEDSAKRSRVSSPPLNNNDATPTDFSMVKNNHLSSKVEGNGVHEENSPIEDNIKCEPLELTGGNGGNAGNNEDSSDSGAAASDRPPASASSNEHEPEPEHAPTQNFIPESKLFTSTPGSFNFSMAALTDHTPLSVKFPGLGHGLQTPDLAGTSQGTGNGMHPAATTPPSAMYRIPPPTAGGINEPQECPYCRRTFSCYYSLKRHFQDKHEQSDTLFVCEFCNRRYRTKNSLTTHKSLQHRGSSGMLKRLLKTSAMKNVLGSMQQAQQLQQQPQ